MFSVLWMFSSCACGCFVVCLGCRSSSELGGAAVHVYGGEGVSVCKEGTVSSRYLGKKCRLLGVILEFDE